MEIVRTEDLSFGYPGDGFSLADVSFSVGEGELVMLCGVSGCGKSTLLRLLKPELAPFGSRSGGTFILGTPFEQLTPRISAAEIGFVGQDPEGGAVTEDVISELAFLPQNLGLPRGEIIRRIAEVSAYFGLEPLIRRQIAELSAGQKQLVQLAAAMAGRPRLLLLDEPTAQLDPRAAEVFLDLLDRLRRELGTAVIISEHSGERIIPRCDGVVYLEGGRQRFFLPPDRAAAELLSTPMAESLPFSYRLSAALGLGDVLRSNSEAAAYLSENFTPDLTVPDEPPAAGGEAVRLRGVSFRYEKHSPDLISELDMTARFGELTALCGANGAGKSTLLKLIAGGLRPTDGSITIDGKNIRSYGSGALYRGLLTMLPSEPSVLFTEQSVMDDLIRDPDGERRSVEEIFAVTERLGLGRELLSQHCFDLSGGELQRAALAKLLLLHPRILLLDEPDKGLDPEAKKQLGEILRRLAGEGTAVIFVTHDIGFAAEYADRAVMLFGGYAAAEGSAVRFFAENSLFTTSAALAGRKVYPGCVTPKALISRCLSERGSCDE